MNGKLVIPKLEAFGFQCPIDVRFRDLDAMGHVNNAVYFTYFEVARAAYMRALWQLEDPSTPLDMAELFPFIIAEASCRYLAPVTLGEVLVVNIRAHEVRRKSFEFEYLVTRQTNSEPVASGRSVQVYYEYAARKTSEMPDVFLSRLETMEGGARSS